MALQFDMFADGNGEPQRKRGRAIPSRPHVTHDLPEDAMVRQLEETGRYHILRKLEPRKVAQIIRPGFPLRGAIIDTETTGLDHRKDEIIEIGVIGFTFHASGNIGDVTGVYGGLQQPTFAIPADITRLTGITDDMVKGQSIDMSALSAIIEPADLVIAHNARFDRPFSEAFSPIFPTRPGPAQTPKSSGRREAMKVPNSDI